jgi:urease accessory protein
LIDAADTRLLDSPLGWAGHRVMGTLWFAAAGALPAARRDALLAAARAVVEGSALQTSTGVTSVHDGIVVLRALAPRVEPLMTLLTRVGGAWRELAWQLPPCTPRVWRT